MSPSRIRSFLLCFTLILASGAALSAAPVLTWAGDPATTQAATWRTDATVTQAFAELQPAPDGIVKPAAQRVPARSEDLALEGEPPLRFHTVAFTGLTPDTAYAYRVGDGKTWSEWFQFRTAQAKAAPFTFLFLGDPQVSLREQWSRVWRQAWLTVPDAAFALLTGDLINDGRNDQQWRDWFECVGWVGATRPLILAPGSHEYMSAKLKKDAPRRISPYWRAQFEFPTHGPAGLEETCYFLDYQGVRFVVLNSQEKRTEQIAWLRQVLSGERPRWTVLAFHEPIFSGGRDRDAAHYRAAWKPVIDELGVDLVLTGHDHVYARSSLDSVPTGYPAAHDVVNRTVYVVAVSGTKYYPLSAGPWAVRKAAETSSFQAITVDGDELRYRAWTASGRPFDAFTLKKLPGAARNEIREP
ncbi:metallophosphoesterase family protein [Opitutus sp. ER46]|uniref:purple acid phosphatase family protein n=1 Tax=Opitutus sp. ER46 TaxID=2161864 RepID=UPI000D30A2AB|nr:metallophosphoesterase family protein [Opitutus sp. ER46]PTX98393.1 metallophosphoesterase [Opitutus sp. ER46]